MGSKVFQALLFFEGIHASPEPIVLISHKFVLANQPLEGLYDQFITIVHVFKDVLSEDEVTTV